MIEGIRDVAVLVLVQLDDEDMIRVQSFFSFGVLKKKSEGSSHLHLNLVSMMVLIELFLAEDLSEHVYALLETFYGVRIFT